MYLSQIKNLKNTIFTYLYIKVHSYELYCERWIFMFHWFMFWCCAHHFSILLIMYLYLDVLAFIMMLAMIAWHNVSFWTQSFTLMESAAWSFYRYFPETIVRIVPWRSYQRHKKITVLLCSDLNQVDFSPRHFLFSYKISLYRSNLFLRPHVLRE